MEIPTNEAGEFEAVNAEDEVVGTGTVTTDPDYVSFTYTDGEQVASVSMPRNQFETIWEMFPQLQALTLRAAPS